MDPAGFAPASLGTNTKMLLHTLRARVHTMIINKKNPSFKKMGFFLWYPRKPVYGLLVFVFNITKLNNLSMPFSTMVVLRVRLCRGRDLATSH